MLSEKYMHATPKRDIVKMIQSFVLEDFLPSLPRGQLGLPLQNPLPFSANLRPMIRMRTETGPHLQDVQSAHDAV